MTWIKPSFLWMMYRSGWATKPGQEHIQRVHDFAVLVGYDVELADPELTIDRLGTHRFGDPWWSQPVAATARVAAESALAFRHAAAGTTHLLAGLITTAGTELNSLFTEIGADLSELDRMIHYDLSVVETAWEHRR